MSLVGCSELLMACREDTLMHAPCTTFLWLTTLTDSALMRFIVHTSLHVCGVCQLLTCQERPLAPCMATTEVGLVRKTELPISYSCGAWWTCLAATGQTRGFHSLCPPIPNKATRLIYYKDTLVLHCLSTVGLTQCARLAPLMAVAGLP